MEAAPGAVVPAAVLSAMTANKVLSQMLQKRSQEQWALPVRKLEMCGTLGTTPKDKTQYNNRGNQMTGR